MASGRTSIRYRAALSGVIAADLVKGGLDTEAAQTQADAMIACVFPSVSIPANRCRIRGGA